MKILISAAEASSDVHGAALLRALKSQAPQGVSVDAFGVGGPKLQAEGLRPLVDARELLSMGFTEVLGKLPRILSALNLLSMSAKTEKPDLAVVIDYPDFHFKLARRLKELSVPVIYYIPPKVWVWRKGRVNVIRELFSKVLCIFPFEKEVYDQAGVPVRYVGNPLLDELPLDLSRAEARARLKLNATERVLVVLPGSRPSELKKHLETLLRTTRNVAAKLGHLVVLMPLPETAELTWVQASVDEILRELGSSASLGFEVRLSQGNSAECMIAADAGLIKSGTSTLEAGLLGCPHTVVYKTSWLSEFIFQKLIRYAGPVGLVNLVSGWKPGDRYLVRELICQDFTEEKLTQEALDLLENPVRRTELKEGFLRLRSRMQGDSQGGGPSATAAEEIWKLVAANGRARP